MRKWTFLLLIAVICGCYSETRAQVNVTSVSAKNDADNFYKMMKEAFPLSFNDPASPRFVFFNKNKNFVFGVGGFVQVQGLYDFNGVPNDNYFTTNSIALKGQQAGGRYGITIGQSRLFFKLVGDTEVGRLVTYMEMEFEGENNTPILRQAFIKFKGFTIGKTWSTFCDISAGPATIDEEGPSSEIALRQPQIRYTYDFTKNLQASLAIEYVEPSYTDAKFTEYIHQRIPDIPLTVRYAFKDGSHLQAGGILRNMYYKNTAKDKDKIVTGWGVALSGIWQFAKNTSFNFQGVYGKGISNYIQDLSGIGLDLVPSETDDSRLKAFNAWGGFAGFAHQWNEKLSSNIMYSYARVLDQYGMPSTSYKYAQYAAANLFWDFSEYGSCGIEYVYGRRNDFNKDYGNANRINTMIQYRF
ncbi:DcaP family trimeric outer membrane transporter [uncultured Sanguibacteroides sp.]|uniref:DcaP family trimeric outer membrane transporter n=1 Tax=uncultured Sanguibacteroides sp. TaxID=1635151 RepID=UPI0025CF9CA4|nr:DcaP family trimeric outer membrane transporter [uncultured Sanguibacteroides sp.]